MSRIVSHAPCTARSRGLRSTRTAQASAPGGEEGPEPAHRLAQVVDVGQRHDAQVVGIGPVETGALDEQQVLLAEQVQNQLLVVLDLVHVRVEAWEQVERALR